MNNEIGSLVVFSILAQAASGLIIMSTIAVLYGRLKPDRGSWRYVIPITAGLILGIGLITSFFHLGNPGNAIKALNNIESSWISREILATIILLLLLAMWLMLTIFSVEKRPIRIIMILSSLVASILVYIMIRVYTIPAMKFQFTPVTTISFISTTLFSGCALLWIIERVTTGLAARKLLYLSAIFLSASMVTSLLFSLPLPGLSIKIFATVILYSLALISVFPIFIGTGKNNWDIYAVISISLGITAEVITRFMFLTYTGLNI